MSFCVFQISQRKWWIGRGGAPLSWRRGKPHLWLRWLSLIKTGEAPTHKLSLAVTQEEVLLLCVAESWMTTCCWSVQTFAAIGRWVWGVHARDGGVSGQQEEGNLGDHPGWKGVCWKYLNNEYIPIPPAQSSVLVFEEIWFHLSLSFFFLVVFTPLWEFLSGSHTAVHPTLDRRLLRPLHCTRC